MAQDWYQVWLADKKKRDQQAVQNPKTNKVDFHQASLANNIQYTLPGFTGRSGNDGVNTKWEKNMLQPLSIKQYGRSYADKFNNLVKSMGMSESQAMDFRRYLDYQEQSQQQYKMQKDGKTPDNRHTVYAGQGMHTQADVINGILKDMSNPNTPTNQLNTAIQNVGIKDMQVPVNSQPTYKPSLYAQINSGAQRVGDQFLRTVLGDKFANQNAQDQINSAKEYLKANPNDTLAKRDLYAAEQSVNPATSNADKALNYTGGTVGTVAPFLAGDGLTGLGADALKTLGILKGTAKVAPTVAKLAGMGALSGLVGSGVQTGARAVIGDPYSTKDTLLNAGMNTALGAGGNVFLGKVASPLFQRIIGKITKGKTISQVAKEENIPEEQVHQAVQQWNISNVLADKKPNMPNPIEKPLNINPKSNTPTMDNFTISPDQIPQVDAPVTTNDWLGYVNRQVSPRGQVPKGPMPTYAKEALQNKADQILQKVVQPTSYKPIGYHSDLWNQVAEHKGPIHPEQIQQILDHADALSKDMTKQEQDFVHQYVQSRLNGVFQSEGALASLSHKGDYTPEDMQALMNIANGHETNLNGINQQATDYALSHPNYQKAAQKLIDNAGETNHWNAVKQLKQEYVNLRGTLDGINFTASDKENFGDIPKVFKTAKGGIDISKATELLGLNNPEETVQYLQKLAEANRTKMADVVTNPKLGTKAASAAQMKKLDALQKILESEYRKGTNHKAVKVEMQKALDLIAQGKGSNTFHAEAQNAFQHTPYAKSLQPIMDGMQNDLNRLQNPTKEDIYQALRKHDDPKTLNHLLDVAMKDMNDVEKAKFIESLNSDPRIKQKIREMSPKKTETSVPKSNVPKAQGIDELLTMMNGVKQGDRSFLGLKPKQPQTVDEILRSLKKEPTSTETPSGSDVSRQAAGKQENVKPSQTETPKDMLLRMNLQQHEDSAIPPMFSADKPLESVTPIQSLPWYKRIINSHIEKYMNSTHSANVAHQQVLEKAIKDAEAVGKFKKASQLRSELKNVKRKGSSFEWAMANEKTAGNKTKVFLDHHLSELQNALGSKSEKDMADALRYQFAKNIRWIWDHVNPDYEVGGGWDTSYVNGVVNSGVGNPKLQAFTDAMRNLTQEWRDQALKSNLITKAQHEALSKNPFYIPMARDVTKGMDNIARGLKGGSTSNKSRSGLYFVHALGQGDAEAMFKNPMETIVNNSFSLFRNVAKADTGKEALRLAKLDKGNLFFKEVSKKYFDANGGIEVHTPQGTKYVQMQEDLMKMYKENDLPLDLNVLGQITRAFAGAKVRSLQYQFTGVPRDLAEGYLKGQTTNPFKYLKELALAAKNHNIDAKQAGAYFDHAYNNGMGDINPEKLVKEFAKQNGEVRPFNPKSKESWKDLTRTIGKIADMPFKPAKWLGQMSDELPRSVEVKITKEKFMKKYGTQIKNVKSKLDEVNQQIDATQGIQDPFHPALQGIDKLHAQKTKLENILNEFDRKLQQEQTYRGRDIMNFGQIGRSGIAKHIKQYAAFANTGTQSKYKLIRALIERPVATTAKIALLTAPLVYAEKVMQQNLTGDDKKLYDDTPNYIKELNYVYVHDGKVYTLPKIQELAVITNPIEAMLTGDKSSLNQSARFAAKESIPYQAGNFLQGLVPGQDGKISRSNFNSPLASTVFEPITDVAANSKVGFNHNPISYADQFGRKNPKANKWTMDIYRGAFKNKPAADYAQYAVEQYGGDAGKYLEAILNAAKKPSDKARIDQAIQMLNPAQDRAYGNIQIAGHQVFKSPYKKSKITKK